MKKIIRYLIIGVVAAIVFTIATVAIFIAVFDANAYQDQLTKLVRDKTGRSLQFHGEVNLTLYPALGMKLGAMSLSNPPAFGVEPMVKVKEVSVSVDMASLVQFAPEIDRLVLRDLEIDLITSKTGANNWDDLIAAPVPETQSSSGNPTTTSSDFNLEGAFGGLDLQNLKLRWQDRQNGAEYRVNDLDVNTGRITPDAAFPMSLRLDANANGGFDILVDFNADLEYRTLEQRLVLTNIRLALNEFELGGQLELSEFAKATPALRFDLRSDGIDADALFGIPPVQSTEPGPVTQTAATDVAEDLQIPLPMQTLRDLDIDGRLVIVDAKLQNLRMSNVAVNVKAKNGVVGLKPLSLDAYGGQVVAEVVVDVKSQQPKYGIDKSIQGIQVGDLLDDYQGLNTISGTLNAQANVTTRGEWLSELNKNSNGRMRVEILDGAYQGFNLRQSIDAAKAKLRGREAPTPTTRTTDFASLSLSGPIRNGVFSSDDLDIQAPLLRVGGKGSADLNNKRLDYRVDVKLVESTTGQQGDSADELAGLTIPVNLKGPFTAIDIDVLLDDLLKAKVDAEKAAIKGDIEKQKAELTKQIEAEKKALAESKKRELEKQRELEAVKARKKLKEKQNQIKKKLADKLKKLSE